MKKSIIIISLLLGFIFVGCSVTSNVDTPQIKTSKQVEKELDWKYCKEYK
jgi:PBP1b-binding outer membrane lipoprotein LpoB